MAVYSQLPGKLDIKVNQGDDLSINIDFGIDLSGYTFESKINNQTSNSFLITVTNEGIGEINISLTDAQTKGFGKCVLLWELIWTVAGMSRTVLDGELVIL